MASVYNFAHMILSYNLYNMTRAIHGVYERQETVGSTEGEEREVEGYGRNKTVEDTSVSTGHCLVFRERDGKRE